MDCSPRGSYVHGILQARIPEWVAVPFSRGSSWPRDQTCVSYISCIGRQVLYHCATWERNWLIGIWPQRLLPDADQPGYLYCLIQSSMSLILKKNFFFNLFILSVSGLSCSVWAWLLHGRSGPSSQTRDQIWVPCIGRQILNHWTTREVPPYVSFLGLF